MSYLQRKLERDNTPLVRVYKGVVIERRCEGHAYARNGNAHNPTAYYYYLVKLEGGWLRYGTLTRAKARVDQRLSFCQAHEGVQS